MPRGVEAKDTLHTTLLSTALVYLVVDNVLLKYRSVIMYA